MASCCIPSAAESTGKFFSKHSAKYARSFRKGKLTSIQRSLVYGIQTEPLIGKSVLDIGSGVGALHLTLLRNGATTATAVDLSDTMLHHAKSFARQFGVESQVTYRHGDFLSEADSIEPADITLLDKVVCCYDDIERLIAVSTNKTKSLYALTYPTDNLVSKTIFKAEIAISTLFRSGFRPYWHDWRKVPELIAGNGFTPIFSATTLLWQAMIFSRVR